jgi:hypothetical protein
MLTGASCFGVAFKLHSELPDENACPPFKQSVRNIPLPKFVNRGTRGWCLYRPSHKIPYFFTPLRSTEPTLELKFYAIVVLYML